MEPGCYRRGETTARADAMLGAGEGGGLAMLILAGVLFRVLSDLTKTRRV
jgi:hypothetical protein